VSRDELLAVLRSMADGGDEEINHGRADDALLEFIGDPEVTAAFRAIAKWYA
jgi:hypothetical protein